MEPRYKSIWFGSSLKKKHISVTKESWCAYSFSDHRFVWMLFFLLVVVAIQVGAIRGCIYLFIVIMSRHRIPAADRNSARLPSWSELLLAPWFFFLPSANFMPSGTKFSESQFYGEQYKHRWCHHSAAVTWGNHCTLLMHYNKSAVGFQQSARSPAPFVC